MFKLNAFLAIVLLLFVTSGFLSAQDSSVVKCANLIYGKNKSSVCFSAKFMSDVNKRTHISTDGQFTAVKLDSGELFNYPFAVMTGEGTFELSNSQRESMRNYLTYGGFIVASAGCSSRAWSESFRKEIRIMFPESTMKKLDLKHPLFHTYYEIRELEDARRPLEGLEIDGKIVMVFSSDGLNDSSNAEDDSCCCCGGNEIDNARQVNVNLLIYALTH